MALASGPGPRSASVALARAPLLQKLGGSLHGREGSGQARAGGGAGVRFLTAPARPGHPESPPQPPSAQAVHDRSSRPLPVGCVAAGSAPGDTVSSPSPLRRPRLSLATGSWSPCDLMSRRVQRMSAWEP